MRRAMSLKFANWNLGFGFSLRLNMHDVNGLLVFVPILDEDFAFRNRNLSDLVFIGQLECIA